VNQQWAIHSAAGIAASIEGKLLPRRSLNQNPVLSYQFLSFYAI
jgi:hypothetical protein